MKILVTAEFDTDDDGDRYKGMSFDQVAAEIKRESADVPGAKFISVVKSESQENVNLADSSAKYRPSNTGSPKLAAVLSDALELCHNGDFDMGYRIINDVIGQLRAGA